MAQSVSSTKFTYEDYILFPDDGRRHELIDGDHLVTPSPRTKHQKISGNLHISLGTFVQKTKCGLLLAVPADVVLSDLDVVQPDLLYICAARALIITEKNIQGAPDLVVEILSDTSRKTDEIIKRKLYERYQIQEYWIIDPELETMKIYRLSGRNYSPKEELSLESESTLSTPLLPDWKISLHQLFE